MPPIRPLALALMAGACLLSGRELAAQRLTGPFGLRAIPLPATPSADVDAVWPSPAGRAADRQRGFSNPLEKRFRPRPTEPLLVETAGSPPGLPNGTVVGVAAMSLGATFSSSSQAKFQNPLRPAHATPARSPAAVPGQPIGAGPSPGPGQSSTTGQPFAAPARLPENFAATPLVNPLRRSAVQSESPSAFSDLP